MGTSDREPYSRDEKSAARPIPTARISRPRSKRGVLAPWCAPLDEERAMKFRKRVSTLASMALVAPMIVASVATAELRPWDQEKVTAVRDAVRGLNRIPTVKPVEANTETVAGMLKRLRPFYEKDPISF